MRIHRFYMENIDKNEQNIFVTQETDLIHQLKNVFRYKVGQKIQIFNETRGEIEVEIFKINKKDMSFKYTRQIKTISDKKDTKRQIVLYMSIIKNSNFDLIVEKAVELGIDKIVPVITERTIKDSINYVRLGKIIKEATEQSGRMDLMKIGNALDLNNAIKQADSYSDVVYFGSIDKNIKSEKSNKYTKTGVFIGPEGGYSDEEISLFTNNKIIPLKLGDYVLRAETAAIVACGIMSLK